MEWAIFGSAFVLILIALAILAEHLRQKRRQSLQAMAQQERMAAMEKGLPLPEYDILPGAGSGQELDTEAVQARRMAWFRFTALCLGLVFAFAGIGMGVAFQFSMDRGFHGLATLGAIPLMTGIGLLVFYFLTRNTSA